MRRFLFVPCAMYFKRYSIIEYIRFKIGRGRGSLGLGGYLMDEKYCLPQWRGETRAETHGEKKCDPARQERGGCFRTLFSSF